MVLLHRKIWIVVISACLLVLASYMAFSRLEDSIFSRDAAKPSQQSPDDSSPVTIRIETDKLIYTLGETVKIRIFLVNNSPDTLKIGPVACGYIVRDSGGKIVIGRDMYGLYPYGFTHTLAPYGETLLTDLFGWRQKYPPAEGSTPLGENVPPGTYTIQVNVWGSVSATKEVTVFIGGT